METITRSWERQWHSKDLWLSHPFSQDLDPRGVYWADICWMVVLTWGHVAALTMGPALLPPGAAQSNADLTEMKLEVKEGEKVLMLVGERGGFAWVAALFGIRKRQIGCPWVANPASRAEGLPLVVPTAWGWPSVTVACLSPPLIVASWRAAWVSLIGFPPATHSCARPAQLFGPYHDVLKPKRVGELN